MKRRALLLCTAMGVSAAVAPLAFVAAGVHLEPHRWLGASHRFDDRWQRSAAAIVGTVQDVERWRTVPAQRNECGVVRQSLLQTGLCSYRDPQRAAVVDVEHAMNGIPRMMIFVQSFCTALAPWHTGPHASAVRYPCKRSQLDRRSRSRQRSEKTEGLSCFGLAVVRTSQRHWRAQNCSGRV